MAAPWAKRKKVDEETRAIIEDLHIAFRGVSRGQITLHEAAVIDDLGSDVERMRARDLDTDRDWVEVPDAHVEECAYALHHLDPESWRYYIPRFMEWSLRNFRTNESFLSDSIIYQFNPSSSDAALAKHAMDRYRCLTTEQSRAVSRFLRYMAQNGEQVDDVVANEALRKYWAQFGA